MPEKFDSSYAKEGGFHVGRYRIGSRKWEDYAIDIAHSNVEGAKYIHDTVRNVGSRTVKRLSRGLRGDSGKNSRRCWLGYARERRATGVRSQ